AHESLPRLPEPRIDGTLASGMGDASENDPLPTKKINRITALIPRPNKNIRDRSGGKAKGV
ncbi:MAG: hypothetical protein Q7S86_01025, partial [bacterium]|nr:hypothetical protein [bacterium]